MNALEFDMSQRPVTDRQTPFWTDLLLVVITCGIYGFYILYQLLERRQQHFERMVSLRWHLIETLRERARNAGREEALGQQLDELERLHAAAAMRDRAGDKSPVIWLLLAILGVLPATFYAMNFLNNDFHDHEEAEQLFLARAGEVMAALGMGGQLPQGITGTIPERGFFALFLLSAITFGIYGIYWWYTLVNDPNNHFNGHGLWETRLSGELATPVPA